MTHNPSGDIWGDDLLGFKERGDAFTNLVTSIDDHRTISIEAGYGRGKTFFRERWAKQLEAVGECVVQVDARLSDHSGDPVVTFLGALLGLVPEKETKKREAVYSAGKKILVAGGKAVAKAALREGFDELADAVAPEEGEASALHDIAKAAGQDLSNAAGELIASQLSAEKARLELNAQLKALHAQITEGRDTDRIIILIDELDRCHPDYAIALLEAMKLVFDQDGFVFVLMVHSEYLESIAQHRFGKQVEGELYLDKFVDLRLKLQLEIGALSMAVETLALARLPLETPFGSHDEFSAERAAILAGKMASKSELSMRQIVRVLDRVELCLRIYKDRPVDAALLVWLAFKKVNINITIGENFGLKRKDLNSSHLESLLKEKPNYAQPLIVGGVEYSSTKSFLGIFPEFSTLLDKDGLSLFRNSLTTEGILIGDHIKDYKHVTGTLRKLAPHYIPDHQAMLDAVHKLQVDP